MNVIYTNSIKRDVSLKTPVSPVPGSLKVLLYEGEVIVADLSNAVTVGSDGSLSVTLPFSMFQTEHNLEIRWSFVYVENGLSNNYETSSYISVVTPYLSDEELDSLNLDLDDGVTNQDIESSVRSIINSHCGQNFGKYIGTISVTGSGEPSLRMPKRLMSFRSINRNNFYGTMLAIRGDGWYLQSKTRPGIPSIRADYDGWHYEPSGVITPPPAFDYRTFIKNHEYEIDGNWGWNYVPMPVKEAAKLLAKDYSSQDSLYRDRFLNSVSTADWRIQFDSGAFSDTGNLRANQLLSEFVLRRGWVVV